MQWKDIKSLFILLKNFSFYLLFRAVQYEELLKKKEEEREKRESEIAELNTKMKQAQIDCDEVQETLQEQMNKLEETDKRATNVTMMGESNVATVVKKKIKEMQTELEKLQFDVIAEDEILRQETALREKAEAEVAAMTRRIRLLEEDLEVSSSRLTETLTKLEEASKTAEESERGRKDLEIRSIADDERLNQLEDQQKEAKYIAEDADRKYDEAARKLAIAEVDFERAEARLEAAESKIVELEEELRVVGNNMKALEISEQESAQREESYEETIRDLTERLKASAEIEKDLEERLSVLTHHVKEAEQRATEAERQVSKLQNEVDHLEAEIFTHCHWLIIVSEQTLKRNISTKINLSSFSMLKLFPNLDDLLAEKERYKALSGELDQTFAELTGY
ncbi:unnamed protein product [Schistosoma curassoni]|uniref:Tropomyosin n=1 Tax=Schistosoma curassoni TaxID=6186 RepID=A0A183JXU3_9TREM|nr:unnamed protein product [Schistosoma curassoni]